ncbi:MAG: EAL domain-containing protein [Hyphomicrobiales bacterium]|nr:EAL domain-containing protein [Hyphomicrobiales bacterium]
MDSYVSLILVLAIAAGAIILAGVTRRWNEALRQRSILLDAALEHMSPGVNMFDADSRLVLANSRYLQMYRLPPESVKPGMTVRDLVELRRAAGSFFIQDPDAYIVDIMAAVVERKPSEAMRETTDGRTISVVSRPVAGGGWVVTHEDVTARARVERELESTRAFLDAVVENVPAVILVKDARSFEYVLVNRAGEEFYGKSRSAMVGHTAEELFPPSMAAAVATNDQHILRSRVPLRIEEHPIELGPGERRLATTTRLPIMDENGAPRYLLTVVQDLSDRKRDQARIERLVSYDLLTDLPNRSAFNACLASAIEKATLSEESFAVLLVNLDRFKEVNDVFGHSVGDELLRAVGERLSATVGDAFLARLGGDEFAIITTESPAPTRAARLAERLIAAMTDEVCVEQHRVHTGLSVGIALYPIDGLDEVSLLGNADAALWRAKAEGRGSIRFFEADMDHRLRDRSALLLDLRLAIERGQFAAHYQRQARIDGEIVGFEALLRWQHPVRGSIPPSTFIPIAEESRLILEIGEWMLREACREAASWRRALMLAINLSPVQFRHGDLPGLVHQVLLDTGLAPQRLELEITESVLIDDLPHALSVLRRLKALGVRIAMDDFGTGYSSLSNLQAFPFDKIKIDRSFICDLPRSVQAATIVRAVIALGRELDLAVLAEGVETTEQLEFLAGEGCAEVQGYLLGRPLPIADQSGLVGCDGAGRDGAGRPSGRIAGAA